MQSNKDKRKQNKFSKMLAFKNLLENKDSDQELEPAEKKLKFTEEQYKEVQKELNEKKNALKNKPKLILKTVGEIASMDNPLDNRQPLFLDDIHSVALNLYFGSSTIPHNPWRWCHIEKITKVSHTVLVYVTGLSSYEFSSLQSRFKNSEKIFPVKMEVILPASDNLEKFLHIPLVDLQKQSLIKEHGSLEMALKIHTEPLQEIRPIYPVSAGEEEENQNLPTGDVFSRTKLLLSALQMTDEGYPVPVTGDLNYRYADYKLTKEEYKPVTPKSPMFGVDCEMCQTTLGVHEVTRVSVVDERYESVYETFVKPENKITNYMTAFSGITEETLRNVTKTLTEVQEDLRQLLPPDAILVGQSLNVDLNCLKLMHPYVIDTSVIFNISGERKSKSKLRTLAREFLGEIIQNHAKGHDSIEDSAASMKLVQLKLRKSLEYGDMVLLNRAKFNKGQEVGKKGVARTVCIAGSKSCSYDFDGFFKTLSTQPATVENLQVKSFKFDNNEAALKSVAENALQYSYTICNVDVGTAAGEDKGLQIDALDTGLDGIYQNMAPNGCLIAILGGSAENPKKGVALCRVKE